MYTCKFQHSPSIWLREIKYEQCLSFELVLDSILDQLNLCASFTAFFCYIQRFRCQWKDSSLTTFVYRLIFFIPHAREAHWYKLLYAVEIMHCTRTATHTTPFPTWLVFHLPRFYSSVLISPTCCTLIFTSRRRCLLSLSPHIGIHLSKV